VIELGWSVSSCVLVGKVERGSYSSSVEFPPAVHTVLVVRIIASGVDCGILTIHFEALRRVAIERLPGYLDGCWRGLSTASIVDWLFGLLVDCLGWLEMEAIPRIAPSAIKIHSLSGSWTNRKLVSVDQHLRQQKYQRRQSEICSSRTPPEGSFSYNLYVKILILDFFSTML
jgi:hypothetical protein